MPDSHGKSSGGKLEALQALRALAALMVVLDHSILNLIDKDMLPATLEPFAFRCGAAGVYIFFVISGFIMAFTSRHDGGADNAVAFFLRRVWRVVPLYWLATAIYALRLVVGSEPPSLGEMLQSLFFIPYFDQNQIYYPVLGPGWTLNFEMYFYLVFAFSLLLPRALGIAAVAVLFGGSVWLGWFTGWQDRTSGVFLAFFTDPIIAYFLLGIGVHLVAGRLRLSRGPILAGLAIATALGLLACLVVPEPPWLFAAGMLVIAPLAVYLAVQAPSWGQGLASRTTVLLGDASYSLYLTHSFVLGPGITLFMLLHPVPAMAPIFIVAALLACATVGILCYLYVEKPLLALLRPLFIRPAAAPSVQPG